MKSLWILAAAIAVPIATPAAAQQAAEASDPVREGVEAWSRGDYTTAIAKWRAPAEAGNADAQFNLGQAYKLGRGVRPDLAQAEEWYRRAAIQGHPQAADNYGLALFQNGNQREAVQWLEQSALRGEPRAQYVLGTMYFNGDQVERDWVRAYALMVRASQTGLPQASQALAQMDQYVSIDDRQQGLTLARRYEEESNRSQLPVDFAGPVTEPPAGGNPPVQTATNEPAPDPNRIQTIDLPPSQVAQRPIETARAPEPEPETPSPFVPTPQPQPQPQPVPVAQRPAPPPRPAAMVDSGWRVQLGAFSDPDNATDMWRNVSRLSAAQGLQPYYVRSGRLTKLLIGPYASRAEALRSCNAIKASGRDCLLVAP
ncbi:SPOR domain-containing protein [Sphingosinithalassobacter portus]|uniref:SPOR domain-containing protein n=1 Tax=Stakelama portus TaxID=2676234 RepID=UPI000D6E444A|nr:SPOR domain-containing protein [Sphingosinithalassobacter portus]